MNVAKVSVYLYDTWYRNGFYREWTQNGDNTEAVQLERIQIFNSQIEKANEDHLNMIIMGDVNLHVNRSWSL